MEKNSGLIWVVSFGAIVAFHFVVYMGWLQCVCVCVCVQVWMWCV